MEFLHPQLHSERSLHENVPGSVHSLHYLTKFAKQLLKLFEICLLSCRIS